MRGLVTLAEQLRSLRKERGPNQEGQGLPCGQVHHFQLRDRITASLDIRTESSLPAVLRGLGWSLTDDCHNQGRGHLAEAITFPALYPENVAHRQ